MVLFQIVLDKPVDTVAMKEALGTLILFYPLDRVPPVFVNNPPLMVAQLNEINEWMTLAAQQKQSVDLITVISSKLAHFVLQHLSISSSSQLS